MPLIQKNDPLKSAQIEEKIELAISNLKYKRIHSIYKAIKIYTMITTALAEPELPASQAVKRCQFRCSGCTGMGHRINQCPNSTSN
jgi:hypothetical protein